MSKARDIAQCLVIVCIVVILLFLLTGCLTISQDTERRLGGFIVDADCDDETVHVELQIDEEHTDQDAGVEK